MPRQRVCTVRMGELHSATDFKPVSRLRPEEVAEVQAVLEAVPEPTQSRWMPHKWLTDLVGNAFDHRAVPTLDWAQFDRVSVCDYLLSGDNPFPVLLTGAMVRLQLDWTPRKLAEAFKGQKCVQRSYIDGRIVKTTFDRFVLSFDQAETREESFRLQVYI